ncbi:hypothetical protein BDF22DRAFT_410713 [Syncephalis plumigaleata]|nr:hypothetical protein BDF22DRAFT_410713 [Syncephalis plumigaleata]
MDIRLVFLLFLGTIIYFVYFYHGRRTNAKSAAKKKKKKRHGKKQTVESQENDRSAAQQPHKVDVTTSKHANGEGTRSIASSATSNKKKLSNSTVESNDNVQGNAKTRGVAADKVDADSTSDEVINTPSTKHSKSKKSSSRQQQKRNAQQQQFDAEFPALPTKTYQENNDMLPEEKEPVYARVLRITPPEKEKKEPIPGARKQRAIAGPDGWFTVKTVAEASIPRTTQAPKKEPANDDGLTKRQRANRRRAELNKEEKELQRLEQERRLMNHRIAQAKALYK